ncbi:hypothetical protein AUJ67_06315 [Candidatus Desantisbacteria bacterium CG1_02_49_89]|nr:MAG: hypothetical protein AUJ67_06315 [Candidatus Desantisbacteria bacterium CG1_02_49_89]
MSYLEYYNFKEIPFANAPDLRFYYDGYQYGYTEERLIHIVNNMSGLAVVIGGMGMGKSILSRHLLDRLSAVDTEYQSGLMVIVHTAITASWLLKKIALQLEVPEPAEEKTQIISQLYNRLTEIHEEGRKAVILVDEANMLQTREIMEEFRGLLNLEVPGKKLITFLFFGMPELDEYLRLDEPLRQRIALRIMLRPLSLDAVHEYIKYRMDKVESSKQIFNDESIKLIHTYSRGIPRLVNTICDNALLEGFLLKRKSIDPEVIERISGELMLAEEAPPALKSRFADPAETPMYAPDAPKQPAAVSPSAVPAQSALPPAPAQKEERPAAKEEKRQVKEEKPREPRIFKIGE